MKLYFTLVILFLFNSFNILHSEVLFDAGKWEDYYSGLINGQYSWGNYGTQKAGETRTDEISIKNAEIKSVELNFNTIAQDVRLDLGYTLSQGNSIFYGISFSVSSIGQSDYFVGFQNKQAGQTPHLARLFLSTLNPGMEGDFALGITTNGQNKQDLSLWNDGLHFDQMYTAIIGYDYDSGISCMWLNPTSITDISVVSQDTVAGRAISRIFMRSGEQTNNQISIYDFIVADSFEEVLNPISDIPEASGFSFILGVFGLFIVCFRRR